MLEKFGVRPDQVVDVLALMGDTIDNIKGVPGIGEKGARELISAHGSLDALLAAARTSSRSDIARRFSRHADSARASRELARIRTDVPVTFDRDALRYRGPSRERCYALFSSLGFRTLVQEYAPTAEMAARDYGVTVSGTEIDALDGRRQASRTRSALRRSRRDVSGRGGRRRLVVLDGAGHGPLRPDRPRGPRRSAERQPRGAVRAGSGRSWPIASVQKVGHDLKFVTIASARQGIDSERPARRHDGR